MEETRENIQNQLQGILIEQEDEIRALDETRTLLKRADQKKKENPQEKKRWGATVTQLEAALFGHKRALTVLDNKVLNLRKKLDRAGNRSPLSVTVLEPIIESAKEDLSPPIATPSHSSPLTVQDRIDTIIKRTLDIPIIKIKDISQEDYRLVRAFLESPSSRKLNYADLTELKKRVSIIERNQSPASSHGTGIEKSTPKKISTILQKCANLQYTELTIGEINLLKNFYQEQLEKEGQGLGKEVSSQESEKAVREIRNILNRWLNF